ncbi:DUF5325 family protein [Gracilibacillus alcaliphilus]|uniref:DUF5325 family protein n=1 Tax=Gracilibacillus alcaliphilus TaxID=1401441 RepID=UPI00195A1933|nr:DUF5325 family protein [Gracilibacillus alcaliphilus]MBM7678663.1 putative membrane protein [Gracilibacillus alcaliphilus]
MNFQLSKLLLAICVILSFSAAGVAIAFRSPLFIVLTLVVGFVLMGMGIAMKRRQPEKAEAGEIG